MAQMKLSGKTALITGASRGLGKAMALALARGGAKLALVSRDAERLKAVAKEAGGGARVFIADVSREEDVVRLEREVGPVQILINNAGVNVRKPVTDLTLDEWNSVIGTNLTAAFLICRAFVPHMKGTGYGRVINITSTMSHVSIPARGAYSSSKFGLLGFTHALALELAPEGITVNGISPGPFATEMNTALIENPELNRQFLSKIPLGRWGRPEEVGELAVFLCAEEAGFITGTDILIDGGWCAQ
jgi:NAD(P)-dependent dehydrogenase (short-subunit alcohol dehydrogenase family)